MSPRTITIKARDGSYFASIVRTRKVIAIPAVEGLEPLGPVRFENLIYEAAIYREKPRVLSKPMLVIHVDDGSSKPISEHEFSRLIFALVQSETIGNLCAEKTFEKFGFLAVVHHIWSIWFFQKIPHVFLMNDPSL